VCRRGCRGWSVGAVAAVAVGAGVEAGSGRAGWGGRELWGQPVPEKREYLDAGEGAGMLLCPGHTGRRTSSTNDVMCPCVCLLLRGLGGNSTCHGELPNSVNLQHLIYGRRQLALLLFMARCLLRCNPFLRVPPHQLPAARPFITFTQDPIQINIKRNLPYTSAAPSIRRR